MTRIIITILISLSAALTVAAAPASTRAERKAIEAGNAAYRAKDYARALSFYKVAERENPASLVARFNQGLAQMQVANAMDGTKKEQKEQKMAEARKALESVAANFATDAALASRANYNLGNLSYIAQDYQAAVDFYKQALRLNPNDDRARKNLRLAQMKLPKDKKDDKQDKKNDKDKKQDKKDRPKPQPQQNKDQKDKQDKQQNQQQQPQQQRQQPQQRQGGMSQQAADRILKHSSDKEKQTMRKAMYGNERANPSSRRRW